MGIKLFKLKISRIVITSFHSCNSKHSTSTLPSQHHFPVTNPTVTPNTRRPSSAVTSKRRHRPSSAFTSVVGCGISGCSGSPPPSQEFRWRKEEKWHVVFPPSPARKKKPAATATFRTSTSSAGPESGGLSAESSSERSKKRRSSSSSSSSRRRSSGSSDGDLPAAARLSAFKKLIPCGVDGKVKESFAVVKRSRDPQDDFKRSMMEMIVEKEMFEKKELEQLLECFLSLNARHYHGFIVGAFSQIWEDLFGAAE